MTPELIEALRKAGYITIQEADELLNIDGLTRQRRQQIFKRIGIKSERFEIVPLAEILASPRFIRENAKRGKAGTGEK